MPEKARCPDCGMRSRALTFSDEERDAWLQKHRLRCANADRAWTCRYCGAQGRRTARQVNTRAIVTLRDHYKRCRFLPPDKHTQVHKNCTGPYGGGCQWAPEEEKQPHPKPYTPKEE